MSFVPGDRQRFGLVLPFTLADNLVLTQYDETPYARGISRDERAIEEWAARAIAEYDIRAPSPRRACRRRSRVATSRRSSWHASSAATSRSCVLDQPTRGLDVGSIEFIHERVIAKRDQGAAVLLVSAELDEVMELSDRIGVMYAGVIVAAHGCAHGEQGGRRAPHGDRGT